MDIKQKYKPTKNALFIYFILIIVVATYFFIWKRMSNIYKSYIINNNFIDITYNNVKTSGFPFKIKFTFDKVVLKNGTMLKEANVSIDKLTISNLIFTNKLNFDTNEIKINYKDRTQTISIQESKDNNFSLNFDKNTITNINVNFDLLKAIDNKVEDREFLFKKLSFKEIKKAQDINTNIILNTNVENIITMNKTNNEEIANFSFKNNVTIANDVYNDVLLNSSISADDIILYNVKDNYYFKINGEATFDLQKQKKSFDFWLKVLNPENIKINDEENLLQSAKIIAQEIQHNEKDTKNELYYHLTKKIDEDEYYLNNENTNDILLRILPIIQNALNKDLLK